jgi:hypothetical protein
VKTGQLKLGKEYRPRITVRTDAGILRPQLLFRKPWPWLLIEAAALAAVIAGIMMMR